MGRSLFLTVHIRLVCTTRVPQYYQECSSSTLTGSHVVQTSWSERDISQASQSLSEPERCMSSHQCTDQAGSWTAAIPSKDIEGEKMHEISFGNILRLLIRRMQMSRESTSRRDAANGELASCGVAGFSPRTVPDL